MGPFEDRGVNGVRAGPKIDRAYQLHLNRISGGECLPCEWHGKLDIRKKEISYWWCLIVRADTHTKKMVTNLDGAISPTRTHHQHSSHRRTLLWFRYFLCAHLILDFHLTCTRNIKFPVGTQQDANESQKKKGNKPVKRMGELNTGCHQWSLRLPPFL